MFLQRAKSKFAGRQAVLCYRSFGALRSARADNSLLQNGALGQPPPPPPPIQRVRRILWRRSVTRHRAHTAATDTQRKRRRRRRSRRRLSRKEANPFIFSPGECILDSAHRTPQQRIRCEKRKPTSIARDSKKRRHRRRRTRCSRYGKCAAVCGTHAIYRNTRCSCLSPAVVWCLGTEELRARAR